MIEKDFILKRTVKTFTRQGTNEHMEYVKLAQFHNVSFTTDILKAIKMNGKFANEFISGAGRSYDLKRIKCI